MVGSKLGATRVLSTTGTVVSGDMKVFGIVIGTVAKGLPDAVSRPGSADEEGRPTKTNRIQRFMKQPTNQEERNQDRKKPEKENPSHGIDPESKESEMEVDLEPRRAAKGNQNKKKDDPLAA